MLETLCIGLPMSTTQHKHCQRRSLIIGHVCTYSRLGRLLDDGREYLFFFFFFFSPASAQQIEWRTNNRSTFASGGSSNGGSDGDGGSPVE